MSRPTRRTRRSTYRDPLSLLLDEVQAQLIQNGSVRVPAGPWFRAGLNLLRGLQACGRATPDAAVTAFVEQQLRGAGLNCAWWWGEVLISVPGWKRPRLADRGEQLPLF